jgi:hypothetical protein
MIPNDLTVIKLNTLVIFLAMPASYERYIHPPERLPF